jgi:hypothetical protein
MESGIATASDALADVAMEDAPHRSNYDAGKYLATKILASSIKLR